MTKHEADAQITELFEKYDRAEISFEDMTFQADIIRRDLKKAEETK